MRSVFKACLIAAMGAAVAYAAVHRHDGGALSNPSERAANRSSLGELPRLSLERRLNPNVVPEDFAETVATVCSFGPDVRDVASALHLIRLWSVQPAQDSRNQREIAATVAAALLDKDKFEQLFKPSIPFVVRTRYGARFAEPEFFSPLREKQYEESHIALTLSVLAELGVAADTPLDTSEGRMHIRDAVDDLVANFSPEMEQEWATVALAFYVSPARTWTNKFGEQFSFDSQVEMFTAKQVGQGSSCGGTHALYTLAVLLNLDQRTPILSDSSRRKARGFLEGACRLLARSQLPSGAWDITWAQEHNEQRLDPDRQWNVVREVLITGHHLEWIAISDVDLPVRDDILVRAAEFISRETRACDRRHFLKHICPYSHGPRALALLTRPTL